MSNYTVGILVVSDSCAKKVAEDQSGVNLREIIKKEENLLNVTEYDIVPDDMEKIKEKLIDWCDNLKLNLILTTGGSGFSPKDLTPDATKQIIERDCSCLTHAVLVESLKITRFAMLSRATSGIRKRSLIINLAGSKKASQEGFYILQPVLKHALDLIHDFKPDIKTYHEKIQSNDPVFNLGETHNHHQHSNQNHEHAHQAHACIHQESRDIANTCKTYHEKIQSSDPVLNLGETHHHHQHSNQHHEHTHQAHACIHQESKNVETADRPRKSIYPMISVEEAMNIVLNSTQTNQTEEVYFMDALNRVSASSVFAVEPLPPYAASVKDGFAIKLNEQQKSFIKNKCESKGVKFVFDVVGASDAGDEIINIDLKENECVKINTGAPVPIKADAVIQIEDTISLEKNQYGQDTKIEIVGTSGCGGNESNEIDIKLGQDIRPIGFDIKIGEEVVRDRTLIKAPQIGICATVGASKIKVFKQPVVGLVSTGNELRKADDPGLKSGQIRDSNKPLLYAALKSHGIESIFDAGIANDNSDSVYRIFKNALDNSDVIISTGGVSMGDKDLVRDVLEKLLNCKIHFARMNMKPGKPTTFATCEYGGKQKLLFCLPGNPVSAIVTFNLVVVPCLKKLMGYNNPFFTEIKVYCNFDAVLDPRPEYHRCYLEWPKPNIGNNNECGYPIANSTGSQHSSRLLSMNQANCLVKLPRRTIDKKHVSKGEVLTALVFDEI